MKILLKNRLSTFVPKGFRYDSLVRSAQGQSHAEISRACIDAIKDAVMDGVGQVSSEAVIQHLEERARANRG